MLEGTCDCGAVQWWLDATPARAMACNCMVCRRYGALWAYGVENDSVRLAGRTTVYVRGDTLEFHFCSVCACVAGWRERAAGADGRRRCAVNLRLAEPQEVAAVPVDRGDGLASFDRLPGEGRCVGDYGF